MRTLRTVWLGLTLAFGSQIVCAIFHPWASLPGLALTLLVFAMLGKPLAQLRRSQYRRYFHPERSHYPSADCGIDCNCRLSLLEKLALEAQEPPRVTLPWLWWLSWDGKTTPFRLG